MARGWTLAAIAACAACGAADLPLDGAADAAVARDVAGAASDAAADAAVVAAADAAPPSPPDAAPAGADARVEAADAAPGAACGAGPVAGCTSAREGFECALDHDGVARTYLLHVPASAPAAGAPLLFAFHGLRTTASIMAYVSELRATAEREGFVLVYPEGIDMSFNAGRCCGTASAREVDDVGFTLAILERVAASLCIDRRRVYATGLSNGGHMAYRLACERADVFAAVSSIAGVVAVVPCAPSRPIPILHFHGTEDDVVRYDLGIDGRGAEATVDDWARRNGCGPQDPVTLQVGEVTCRARAGCQGGSAAELCTIQGGGHQWPGGRDLPLLGHNTTDISASAASWAFFARFTRP